MARDSLRQDKRAIVEVLEGLQPEEWILGTELRRQTDMPEERFRWAATSLYADNRVQYEDRPAGFVYRLNRNLPRVTDGRRRARRQER